MFVNILQTRAHKANKTLFYISAPEFQYFFQKFVLFFSILVNSHIYLQFPEIIWTRKARMKMLIWEIYF